MSGPTEAAERWFFVRRAVLPDNVSTTSNSDPGCCFKMPKDKKMEEEEEDGHNAVDTFSPREVNMPIDAMPGDDFTLLPAGIDPHAHRVKLAKEGRLRQFDVNAYAQRKSAASGLMDLSLLMANASQLRALIQTNGNHRFYVLMMVLLCLSLLLQIFVGLLLLFLSRKRISPEEMDKTDARYRANKSANRLNNYTTAAVFILTILNVFIASFGLNDYPVQYPARDEGSS